MVGSTLTARPPELQREEEADRRRLYEQAAEKLIRLHASFKSAHGQIDNEVVIDRERGHFEVLAIGWHDQVRVHHSVIHLDVIGDKVWIQHNGTSERIGDELIEMGVPREHIVLGFIPEKLRDSTDFGVG